MLWSSETPFSYASLPPASSDLVVRAAGTYEVHRTRLLRLTGTTLRRKLLKCDLRAWTLNVGERNVSSEVDVRALSYVHGRDDQDQDIQVNGKSFKVSQNLFDCLEVLSRDCKRWGRIWVDQICINNADPMERSRQVKHMGEIYQRAQEVIVWLGKGLASDEAAVHLIHYAYNEEQKTGEKIKMSKDGLNLLRSFIENPYFKRLWAVQELVLAKNIIVLVGNKEVSWDKLIAVYSNHIFHPHIGSLREVNEECTSLQRINIARTQRTVLDIFDVINGFCKYSCSDSRDHLFGLLGLLDDRANGKKLRVTVDYRRPLEATFLTFCYEMLGSIHESDQLFDMLVKLAHAMGFEGVFYGGVTENEVLEFFHGAGIRSGADVKATIRNTLQAKTVQFQEAATFLAAGVPVEYDMLSGSRIF